MFRGVAACALPNPKTMSVHIVKMERPGASGRGTNQSCPTNTYFKLGGPLIQSVVQVGMTRASGNGHESESKMSRHATWLRYAASQLLRTGLPP